jgi:hydroxymethylpyrimidine/phosphomethylpyrimidine kinase
VVTRPVRPRPVALTIAGIDSGGGAGVIADVKTFAAHQVWGTAVVTAVTAQNTLGVQGVHLLPAEMVRQQLRSVALDIGIDGLKTGMLGSAAIVEAVSAELTDLDLGDVVVDPVLWSGHGDRLLGADAVECMIRELVPRARVITPNLAEAAALIGGQPADLVGRGAMVEAARWLVARGAGAALIKGGHLGYLEALAGFEGTEPAAPDGGSPDCLVVAGEPDPYWFEGTRLAQPHTHGSGCVLAAAITARLIRGADIVTACRDAKAFVRGAIAGGLAFGRGTGPVDPDWERPATP